MMKTQTSKSFQQTKTKENPVEEDYITNLQKQIYYLELEMKLMKDREIETKNKVGGYEILFRDGVPLNEHFLALKTKYTGEKDQFDNLIMSLENELVRIDNENKQYEEEIKNSQKNYHDIVQRTAVSSEDYSSKIFELQQKVINEKNLISVNSKEKEVYNKQLYQINSQNAHINRTIEKNSLFKEDKEEKNKIQKDKLVEKFKDIDKLVERSLLEEEGIKKKFEKTSQSKLLEEENTQMIFSINKIDRELHITLAKIGELENMRELNLKYLRDEALNKKIHEKDNTRLNQELENLGKLNEENLRIKVKENEQKQLLIIRNQIKNSEHKMNTFLSHYKEAEKEARDLLEEKNALAQKLAQLIEETDGQFGREHKLKEEIVEANNNIDELEQLIQEKNESLVDLEAENEKFVYVNEKLEHEIRTNRVRLEEIVQRIELNNILKDVDVGELKLLTQNNAVVNQSINQLMGKWDKVHSKLVQIEEKQKAENENH